MKKKTWIKGWLIAFLVIGLLALASVWYLKTQFHWNVAVTGSVFTESARSLRNPNRGFYYIYGFRIKDDILDYEQLIQERFQNDTETDLAMIQVNLQEYAGGPVPPEGMSNIRALFMALEGVEKKFIVRFLYDWNGENQQYEPENLEIILYHMEQMEEIFRENSHQIFTLQGLFIGNWGEMHGTRYTDTDSMKKLARKLAEVTEEESYLSVRMPAQWRIITEIGDPSVYGEDSDALVTRLGLFNDGMLGSESDYGTYGTGSTGEVGLYGPWTRAEELVFQEELCRRVPNGGEVIIDNPYNDFEAAVADLKTMHITYLNEDYDRNVLQKWAGTRVQTGDVFDGMNGYEYIKRHLGYRLLLTESVLTHNFWKDTVNIQIGLKNAGFAPIYKKSYARLVFYDNMSGEKYVFQMEQNIKALSGGNNSEEVQILALELPLQDLPGEQYTLYFYLEDEESGKHIALANEQSEQAEGYWIGSIDFTK